MILSRDSQLYNGNTLVDILRMARRIITPKESYTSDKLAEDAQGNAVKPLSSEAIKWNVEGALARVSNAHGVTPPDVLQFLDEYMQTYLEQSNLNIDPQYFSNFGDFGSFVSHEVLLHFLDSAVDHVVRSTSQ